MPVTQPTRFKLLAVVVLLALLAAIYWLLRETGALATILNGAALRDHIAQLGAWGPLMVIGLMVLAIMVSPIPSAPIVLGAEISASISAPAISGHGPESGRKAVGAAVGDEESSDRSHARMRAYSAASATSWIN